MTRRSISRSHGFTGSLSAKARRLEWSRSEREILARHYRKLPMADLLVLLPRRTAGAIRTAARDQGLQKEQGLKSRRRAQVALVEAPRNVFMLQVVTAEDRAMEAELLAYLDARVRRGF